MIPCFFKYCWTVKENPKTVIAFLGGVIAFVLVYSLSWKGGLSPLRIILVGVAVDAMFTGLSSALNSMNGGNMSGVAAIVNGNITMKTWDDVKTLVPYVIVGLILALIMTKMCNLLALEDKTARSLGINVNVMRIVISLIAVLLATSALIQICELIVFSRKQDLNIDCNMPEDMMEKRLRRVEEQEAISLDVMQHKAVIESIKHGLLVLTGGPGTGKTTTINTMIQFFESEGMSILLAAPGEVVFMH